MRFTKICITNYRQYSHIEFSFPHQCKSDMHVIIASNGVGKTNLLNAVNWCLYGDEPHSSGSDDFDMHSDERLSLCNLKALEEARANNQPTCPVTVEIYAENDEGQFIFKRVADINTLSYKQTGTDKFEAKMYPLDSGSDMKLMEGKEAEGFVDLYLPKKIREYFYFDGERLLNYLTNTEAASSRIRDSIYEIAGVNFINRAGEHLQEIIKQYQRKIKELSPGMAQIINALNTANANVEQKKAEIKELEVQIENAKIAIADADKILDGTEQSRDANAKYKENKRSIEREEGLLKQAKADLVAFVKKYFYKLMLYDVNHETYSYIEQRDETSSGDAEINLQAIKESLLKRECMLCKQHIPHDIEDELKRLVIKYEQNVSLQTLLRIKNDIGNALRLDDYIAEKQKIFERIRECEDRIQELKDENDKLLPIVEKVGNIQDIEFVVRNKRENEVLLDRNKDKRSKYEEQLITLEKVARNAQSDYDEALKKDTECNEYKEREKFVSRAYEIITEVKQNIVTDIKSQMQDQTMGIFEQLLWKRDTYGRVELDDNFRLQLFHKRTGQSCLYSCSAAEKELLALSFTIALHSVSGYDNLLFIDTPVGRVSDANRRNFANVLLDVSYGKQIILAFTPSEYSDEIKDVLNKNDIASINMLLHDEDNVETTVKG